MVFEQRTVIVKTYDAQDLWRQEVGDQQEVQAWEHEDQTWAVALGVEGREDGREVPPELSCVTESSLRHT